MKRHHHTMQRKKEGHDFYVKAQAMQSPHIVTRAKRFADGLMRDYKDIQAVKDFYKEVTTVERRLIEFKKYKKVARILARMLTPQDYEERQGVVHAPEGILKFTPGDYLAKDAKGEWTIWQSTMRDKYVKVAPEGEDGYAQYLRIDVSFAAQMPESFSIDGMQGKAGDYLVINDGSAWPVACGIFEQSYKLVEEQKE